MVNPIEQNNPSSTVQSGSTNNPDESLKNALYVTEPAQAPSSDNNSPLSMTTTETLPEKTYDINTEDESALEAIINKGPSYEYLNNLGNSGKLGQITVDINGQVTSDRDVTHAITGKPLGLYVMEGDVPTPPPAVTPNAASVGWGDPHFVGFDGNSFEFQGIPNNIFNLLSDAKVQVNALFNGLGNSYYTVMGQIGIRLGKDQLLVNSGGGVNINGSILEGSANLKEGSVLASGGNVSISTKEYSINILNKGSYLDVDIKTTSEGVNRDEVMPTGVIGQTASGNLDLTIGNFIVNDGIFGTNFVSNRFGAKTKVDKLKDKIKEKYDLT